LTAERATARRATGGVTLLSQGFRPFFLLAGLWAPFALAVFVVSFSAGATMPSAFPAIAWHYHEMLFGYVAAALAGFALTAIPNWTGRLPLHGTPLLVLVVLWLAGRIAIALSAVIGAPLAALIDLLFLAALAGAIGREIGAGRNWRNLPLVVAVALFWLTNALIHGEALGLFDTGGRALRLAIAVVIALITLIGGRIIPSFSRNWLVRRDPERLPQPFGRYDRMTLAVSAIALAWWALAPQGLLGGILAAAAGVLNLVRLARWRGLATRAEALLWVLHLAYLWIPVGFALLALAALWPAVPENAAIHALTAGAIATMTLAVMSRATLGHTDQPLHAGPGLTAAYLLVTAAALLRLTAALWSAQFEPLVWAAAAAWIAAYALFLGVCGPYLLAHRRPPRDAD